MPGTVDTPEVLARVKQGIPWVDVIARQLQAATGWQNFDDLQSAGREGLLEAARRYDPTVGVPFRRWMTIRVRGAMIDALRAQSTISRRARNNLRAIEAADHVSEASIEDEPQNRPGTPEQADAQLSSYLANIATAMAMGLLAQPIATPERDRQEQRPDLLDRTEQPDEQLASAELEEHLRQAIELQPDAERHLLKRHYFDGVEFVVAAKELGLSKSWASRLHARAIEGVARELRKRRVAP